MLLATIRRRFTFAVMSVVFLTMILPVNILVDTASAQTKPAQCSQGKLCSFRIASRTAPHKTPLPRTASHKTPAQASSVTLSPTQGTPGTQVVGTGSNWSSGDTILVQWDDGTNLATTTVQSDGTFTVTFTIPSNATQGNHTIYFTDQTAGYFIPATFTISPLGVQKVWTRDVGGNDQTSFVPGEAIQYTTIVDNSSGSSITATFHFEAYGPNNTYIFDQIYGNITVPQGISGWYAPAFVPVNAPIGGYTLRVRVDDQNSSNYDEKEGQFTVNADDLPYPTTSNLWPSPWWSGVCDTNNYTKSNANPNHVPAYTLPQGASVPATYRGTPACGPRPIADNGPDVAVSFPQGRIQELEWECVELSMRLMYIAYGIPAYDAATGDLVVDNYQKNNSQNRILVPVQNNGSGSLPVPGDVLSYYQSPQHPSGHTSVVLATDINSQGTGTITVIEQNDSAQGEETLSVTNWIVDPNPNGGSPFVKNWLHHTLDVWPQTAAPGTSVLVYGEGFQPNEAVQVYFDTSSLAGVTADSNGVVSTTITVPTVGSGQHYVWLAGATTTPITQTVFYVP